jgi:type IV secretory pathway VirB10-like protein
MNNQLVIGVILIVVGIALALLAYAFILNRRDQEKKPEPGSDLEEEHAQIEEAAPEPGTPPPWVKPPAAVVSTPPAEPSPPVAAAPAPPPPSPPPVAQVPAATATPPAALAPSRRTLAVATLLRDEVSGKLLVLVGGHEYATVEELRSSKDYSRVEYAAADLVTWLGTVAVHERASERSAKEEAKKPTSMVAQINDILQRKLVETSGTTRGIRLLEGPGGALRVYIGLASYSFEDVPDAEVKRMIREAVAEWEAKQ